MMKMLGLKMILSPTIRKRYARIAIEPLTALNSVYSKELISQRQNGFGKKVIQMRIQTHMKSKCFWIIIS